MYLFTPGKPLWIESTDATAQTITPSVAAGPPLVYFDQSTPYIVETPAAGGGGTSMVNVPMKLTRSYTGQVKIFVTGSANNTTDFSLAALTPQDPTTTANRVWSISVNSSATTYQIPVTIPSRSKLLTNTDLFMTLQRPVETPAVNDSGTLPQSVNIKITDGMKGVYEAFLESTSTTNLSGQNMRVALRSNGQAFFDSNDYGLISSRFSLPYTIGSDGIPQFTGNATMTLASTNALTRAVSLLITPSTTVLADSQTGTTPAYVVPLTLSFTNLIASGTPVQIPAKITITQANSAQ